MTRENQVKFWLAFLVLFGLALWLLTPILLPFVAGIALAYFLDPVCDRLEAAKLSRTVATLIITVTAILAIIIGPLFALPLLQKEIVRAASQLPEWLRAGYDALLPHLQLLQDYLSTDDLAAARDQATQFVGKALTWVGRTVTKAIDGTLALANFLSLLFITPVVAFYLLRDWDRMVERIDHLLPREHAGVIREQAREVDEILSAFVRGTFTVCIVLGSFYAISLSLIGLPFGLLIGLLAGLISFIPFVGSIVGLVLSVGVALLHFDSWTMWLATAGIFLVGQTVEGNYLTPKLVGEKVNLHPVWVIFALLAGGALFGFVGVLLALPTAAVVGVLVRFSLDRYRDSALYGGGPSDYLGDGPDEPEDNAK